MPTITVTGAAGFIGSNLVHKLNSFGFNDLILVDSLNQFSKTWKYSLKNVKYKYLFEINEYLKYISKLNNHPQFTFHIGAISDTMGHPSEDYFKYNYKYSKFLLDKFADYLLKISTNGYFINVSSSAVYGNGNGPLNAYAMCKLMIDNYILQNHSNFNNQVASCRFFNVYGLNEFHKGKMATMIFKLIREGLDNNTFTIFTPGDQQRDFIYVDDVTNNLIDIFPLLPKKFDLNSDYNYTLSNPIIDFGTGVSHSFNKIVSIIQKVADLNKSKINYITMPNNIRQTYQTLTQSTEHPEYKLNIQYPLECGISHLYHLLKYTI